VTKAMSEHFIANRRHRKT